MKRKRESERERESEKERESVTNVLKSSSVTNK